MKHQTKAMTLCALFAALTAVCAQISIPLPGGVPLSLSVAAVYSTGLLLAPGWAAASQVVYLLLGAFGMPVYAGFSSGMGVLFGPTGGYLFVYPLMALAVSLGVRRWGKGWAPAAGSMSGGSGAVLCRRNAVVLTCGGRSYPVAGSCCLCAALRAGGSGEDPAGHCGGQPLRSPPGRYRRKGRWTGI